MIFMVPTYADIPELSTCQSHFFKMMPLSFFFSLTSLSFWNFLSQRHLSQSYISERLHCQEEKIWNGDLLAHL